METNSVVFFTKNQYPGPKNKPIIAAWQLINPENVGSLIRLADNVGADEVLLVGSDFHLRESSVAKTAGLSFRHIKLSVVPPNLFFDGIAEGYQVVAIETCEDSENIYSVTLPEKIVLLLGNEKRGLPKEILERCSLKVHIPMTGQCKSMNVSHALAVALFEWQRQILFSG